MSPFLQESVITQTCDDTSTYPSYPSSIVWTEGDLPGWFEGLEEFVWLKEGVESKGIQEAKGDQEEKNSRGRGRGRGGRRHGQDRWSL